MGLKTEIDKTNDLKNKTKKAKENINTKLVELGGQNASDLTDVPNKINGLASQYKKISTKNLNWSYPSPSGQGYFMVPINKDFETKYTFINLTLVENAHAAGFGNINQACICLDLDRLDNFNASKFKISHMDYTGGTDIEYSYKTADHYVFDYYARPDHIKETGSYGIKVMSVIHVGI